MAGISSLGVGSGLDLQGILDQLLEAEQGRLKPLTTQKTNLNNQLTSWGIVKSSVAKLETAAENLKKINQIATTAVSSTNEHFSASVKAGANPGSYSVSVLQLAQSQVSQSTVSAGKEDILISSTGNTTLKVEIGALDSTEKEVLEINFEEGTYTLDDIRNKINASDSDIRAEVVYNGKGEGYLALSSRSTGADAAFTIDASSNEGFSENFNDIVSSLNSSETKIARNAEIQLNGVNLISSSNTFENVVEGVSITAKSISPSQKNEDDVKVFESETLTIDKDSTQLKEAIKAYVDAFNEVQTTISNQTNFVATKPGEELSSSNGALLGNSSLRGLQNQLRSQIVSVEDGVFSTLNSLGITLNNRGSGSSSNLKLEIDDKKLDDALSKNTQAVVDFFVGDGKETGFATKSLNQLNSFTNSSTGLFKIQEDSLNSSVRKVEINIENTTLNIEASIERTRIQFQALDRMMAEMNSKSAYLAQQFAGLSNQTK